MQKHPTFKLIFFGFDSILLTISFYLTTRLCFIMFWEFGDHNPYFYFSHFLLYLLFLAVYTLIFRYNFLYRRNIITTRYRQFILIVKSLFFSGLVLGAAMVMVNLDYFTLFGKMQIAYFSLFSFLLMTIIRAGFGRRIFRVLAQRNICQTNVLIVGGDEAGQHVAKSLVKDSFSDCNIVGFIDEYKKSGVKITGPFYNLGQLKDFEAVFQYHRVDVIVVAIDNAPYPRLIQIVEACIETGKNVRVYSNLVNVITERLDVEYYSDIPLVTLSQGPVNANQWKDKRLQDLFLSSMALVMLSPVFLAIMIGIKLSSPGPVFYKQKRIGKGGKPFDFYKFRSMHVNNDASGHRAFAESFIKHSDRCETDDLKVFKITDDPRIFSFGKFIRKSSLDEFPQLYNVLKGDMSLVGPRPCLPYEWECYEPWHRERLNSLPGCTGIWQALGRSSVTFKEMVLLDLYYISNVSFWLDFKIVLKTFPVIFLGKGGF
jgi:undecaprenyl-phosphate galactose phosphotransferase